MPQQNKYKVTYGGWYQRTTLHLSEIYELFALGTSRLELSPKKLQKMRKDLNLIEVTREADFLEYVKAITSDGIEIRYYEDGLYTLSLPADDAVEAQSKLMTYYQDKLLPAINYIFSIGAPTPKILANIKKFHPTVVQTTSKNHSEFNIDALLYGDTYNKITSESVSVFKTPEYIFVVSDPDAEIDIDALIEMQIFFREFKDQLEKYLNIHRRTWEMISEIKDQKEVSGKEVNKIRDRLDSYETTVNLITNRINQMGTYVDTRADIARDEELDKYLVVLFQYKFSVLLNTLDYIKEIWKMTSDYLQTAISIIVEIKDQASDSSIKSLRLITTIGVIAGLMRYLKAFPKVSGEGLIYLVLLMIATYIIEWIISRRNNAKKYKLKFKEKASDI